MVDPANTIWRQFNTDGVMASGNYAPQKGKLREWGTDLEARIGDLEEPIEEPQLADSLLLMLSRAVSTRTALAGLDTSRSTLAYLTEAGREGVFRWKSSDLSARVTADTQQGLYVAPAAATSGASGAWERIVTGAWQSGWFGIPYDTVGDGSGDDAAPSYSAMIAIANILRPALIEMAPGLFNFSSIPTSPTYIFGLQGARAGSQPTIFNKRSNGGATNDLGLLRFAQYAFHITSIDFVALTPNSGSYISAVNPTDTATIGRPHIKDCNFGGTGNVRWMVWLDGTANDVDPLGIRNVFMSNCYIFNGSVGGASFKGVRNAELSGIAVSSSGGSGSYGFTFDGTSAVGCDAIEYSGCYAHHVNFGYAARVTLNTTVLGNLANTSNSKQNTVLRVTGTVDSNWPTSAGADKNVVLATG